MCLTHASLGQWSSHWCLWLSLYGVFLETPTARKAGVENYYHEPSLYARCTSSGRKLEEQLPQLGRISSATVSDSYGYTRPRVAAGPPSVSAPPGAVKDAHPPARTSEPMPAVNAAVSAWYVRDEIGLNSRKTSATSSDKFGYTRLHVTAPPLLNSSPSTAGRTVHPA